MRFIRGLALAYALLCLLALLVIPASIHGWFGIEKDPLGGVFAILLAMPWSMALGEFPTLGTAATVLLLLVGMSANVAILLGIARLIARKSSPT